MWSGPSSSMTYSGTPRPCSAVSSWSEVFQSRPAPIAEAASMSGSKSRCTTSAEVTIPPPLVGGNPAVLVGVRAVGQGALEQLGVQLRVPERGAQLGVVDDCGPCQVRLRGPDDGRNGRRTG